MISSSFKTEQESFWYGNFGNEYIFRNDDQDIISANILMFEKIFSRILNIDSVIEFGSNIGNNIFALKHLFPDCKMSSIEINEKAVSILREKYLKTYNDQINIINKSILDFDIDYKRDMVLIKGVLIHINPSELQSVYQKLYDTSNKYILLVEYYNTTPVEVLYRGETGKLFKRDFAGEMLDKFSDLTLVDYGFFYHRDNINFGDTTYFLLEKK